MSTAVKAKTKSNKKGDESLFVYVRVSDGVEFLYDSIPNILSLGTRGKGRLKKKFTVDGEQYVRVDTDVASTKMVIIKEEEIPATNPNTPENDLFANAIVDMMTNEDSIHTLVDWFQKHLYNDLSGKLCEEVFYRLLENLKEAGELNGVIVWDQRKLKIKHTKGLDVAYIESKDRQMLSSVKGSKVSPKNGSGSFSCHRTSSYNDIKSVKEMYTEVFFTKCTHTFLIVRTYTKKAVRIRILAINNKLCDSLDINNYTFHKLPLTSKGEHAGYKSNNIDGCYFKITAGTTDQLWFCWDSIDAFISNNKKSVRLVYNNEIANELIGSVGWA